MRKRLSVILVMLVVLALVAVSAVAVTYAAGGATTTPTGTPLTQALLGTWLEKEDPYNPNSGKIYKMPSGIYYLAEDIYLVGDDADPNSAWPLLISGGASVTLDLNGHVLDLRGKNISILGSLTLTDSSPEAEHKFRVEDSGLWVLDETQGTETVAGGVITGGTGVESGDGTIGTLGGGVCVSSGSFTMEGGSIVGCTANSGGGVGVTYGSFTMTGGSIAGCTAVKSGNAYGNGGGVYVGDSATFNMNDGSIVGCTADSGGGVRVAYGSFTMEGSSIVGCTANYGGGVDAGVASFTMKSGAIISDCTANYGGGVYVSSGSFTMEDGRITDCTANNGGGIYVQSNSLCKLTMTGGSITSCTAAYAGGGVYLSSYGSERGSFTMTGGSIANCTAGDAANAVHADGSFTDNRTSKIDKSLVSGINGGHTGSETDPILIGSAEGLNDFRNKVNGGNTGLCATLLCDIVLNDGTFDENGTYTGANGSTSAEQWTPIGWYKSDSNQAIYAGTFDGGGHTIKGLYVDRDESDIGLFGIVSNATIKNLTVTGYVKGYGSVGGIVGEILEEGNVTIQNCANYCEVTGDTYVGGIVGYIGYNTKGDIRNCANFGTVKGTCTDSFAYVGGIVGHASIGQEMTVVCTACYNVGTVKAKKCAGGLLGYGSMKMDSCYNVGLVEGEEFIGGLVGSALWLIIDGNGMSLVTVDNCYYLDTATKAFGEALFFTGDTSAWCKSKTQFANELLSLLQNGDTNSPWGECGYLAAAGMTLPLLSWQTADMHTCTPENPSQWESDESGHWQVCSCGLSVNKAAHSGTDDDNCTTDVSCDKCGYVIKLAQTEHDWTAGWTAVRPGTTHEKACTNSGCGVRKTENCSGGTATCKEQATCEVCGKKYGELKSHSYSTDWRANETNHWHECTECRAKTDEAEHTDANMDHKCDVCEKVLTACVDNNSDHKCDLCGKTLSEHTGGEATCTEKAACTICGEKYGDMLPHDYSTDWSCDAAKHWHKCKNCDAKSDEAAHNDADCNHKCDLCNAVISECADNDSNHECDICKKVLSLCTDNDNNHECDICGIIISQCSDVNSDHKCDTCGKILSRCTDTNNDHKCDICGKIISQCSDTDRDHKCDICGKMLSECADTDHDHKCDICSKIINEHTGGKATCSEKAICIICGEQYGEIAAHIYKSEWSSDANNHFHECSICGDKKDQAAHDLKWMADKEPTVTETGIKHEECTVCGYKNTPQSIDKIAPSIIEGNNSKWAKGSKTTLTFRSDAASADFVAVLVDGEILASDYYEKREDSLTTELKPDYLETLSEGEHTLTIRSVSGDASAKFTIEARPVSTLWIILPAVIVVCGGAGAALYFISKRKKH